MAPEIEKPPDLEQVIKENDLLKQEIADLKKSMLELEQSQGQGNYCNRDYFSMRVSEEVARAGRYQYEFSVLVMELDNFSVFSNRLGKGAADEIIGMFDIVMQDALRNTDIKCNFGEGRFAALLP